MCSPLNLSPVNGVKFSNILFSISAKKNLGLEDFFLGIDKNLYEEEIRENIILDTRETEKIKWLYQNQIVQSSELNDSRLKLQLTWDIKQRERFNKNFLKKVFKVFTQKLH